MTEQPEQSEQLDDVERLQAQLEFVQKSHADSLRALQENEGRLLDKNLYNQKRKMLTEAHADASNEIIAQIEEQKEATRRALAENLRYEGNTETDRQAWLRAVEMVENAGSNVSAIEELIHRALRWHSGELARALVMRWGGVPEYKNMHQVLSKVDARVKKAYDYEVKHGSYAKKSATGGTWAGWQTYSSGRDVEIPGRPEHLQPGFLREQKRLQWEQRRAGK